MGTNCVTLTFSHGANSTIGHSVVMQSIDKETVTSFVGNSTTTSLIGIAN